MACVSGVCGTGGWDGPKPGDPDNNVTLTAVPAFGGIDIQWTYPLTNPEAVQHTILFRATAPNFLAAARHAIVSGNFFYDKSTSETPIQYYYWIQLVSVNGTYGAVVGPATATGRPPIAQMIEQLTQKIDEGFLAQSLKGTIDKIQLNKLAIDQEMLDRDAADGELGVAFNEISAKTDQNLALLQQEVLARTNANEAFVTTVNTLYAEMNSGLERAFAAVQVESEARVAANAALAKQITTVQSSLDDKIAGVQQSMTTSVNKLTNGLTAVKSLWSVKVQANGLVGGFGIYASDDGVVREVQAGFDVDTFWIGRTGANKRKPFIVSGSEVFIDQAAINSLVFSKLRDEAGNFVVQNGKIQAQFLSVGDLQSTDYIPNYRGWRLTSAGGFESNGAIPGGGYMSQTNQAIKIFDANGRLRVQLGNLQV